MFERLRIRFLKFYRVVRICFFILRYGSRKADGTPRGLILA
jgi:hypothetical protein